MLCLKSIRLVKLNLLWLNNGLSAWILIALFMVSLGFALQIGWDYLELKILVKLFSFFFFFLRKINCFYPLKHWHHPLFLQVRVEGQISFNEPRQLD